MIVLTGEPGSGTTTLDRVRARVSPVPFPLRDDVRSGLMCFAERRERSTATPAFPGVRHRPGDGVVSAPRVAVFGLGEAGSLFAADLVAAGASVSAYDPAAVPTTDGVVRCDDPRDAVRDAEIVLTLVGAADSVAAATQALGPEPGVAATRKLLRSVVTKGLAGLVIEAMRAAAAAGEAEWVWGSIVHQLTVTDGSSVRRLVDGTGIHHERRLHEMEAAMELLAAVGVEPLMTRSTVEHLARIPGVPDLPRGEA